MNALIGRLFAIHKKRIVSFQGHLHEMLTPCKLSSLSRAGNTTEMLSTLQCWKLETCLINFAICQMLPSRWFGMDSSSPQFFPRESSLRQICLMEGLLNSAQMIRWGREGSLWSNWAKIWPRQQDIIQSGWWMTRQINGVISHKQKVVADFWQISPFNCLQSRASHYGPPIRSLNYWARDPL